MANIDVRNRSTATPGPVVNGVDKAQTPQGGLSMQKMQNDMALLLAKIESQELANANQAAIIQSLAAKTAVQTAVQTGTVPVKRERVVYVAPAEPVAVATVGGLTNGKLGRVESAGKTASRNRDACGSKSRTGELCHKCCGPFNAIKHFTLRIEDEVDDGNGGTVIKDVDLILDLDGKGEVKTDAYEGRQFMGISFDEKYAGNVVFVGFGKDTIQLKPHNAVKLIDALISADAAEHIKSKLDESYWKK